MPISTSSLDDLITAFEVLTEKDSITPVTLGTILRRIAGLMDGALNEADRSALSAEIKNMAAKLTYETERLRNEGESIVAALSILRNTVEYNRSLSQQTSDVLRSIVNSLANELDKEIIRARNAEGLLKKETDSLTNAVTAEQARAQSSEHDLSMRIGNTSSALAKEQERSVAEENFIKEGLALLKSQLAYEQSRAKNAETAIVAYLISILSSTPGNTVVPIYPADSNTQTVVVDLSAPPADIWNQLEGVSGPAIYQGRQDGVSFTLMHAASLGTHILMWMSGAGINMLTLAYGESKISSKLSRLSLLD